MKFPDNLELIVPTIKALKEMGGTATPAEITNKVIELENQQVPLSRNRKSQLVKALTTSLKR